MKTTFATGKILLLTVFIATASALFAQINEDKTSTEQYRINIVRDNNGQKEVIDRTFSSKAEMDAFMKENNISAPDEKSSWAEKSSEKKEKKIILVEKDGNQADNTELTITYSNFTADERAKLIQQLLETKNCKVEVRHTTETMAYNSGQATQPPVTTSVNAVSSVNNLQLYPNPNKGEFHITFSTDKPSDVKLRIIDMNGKEVYSDKIKNNNGDFNKDISIRPSVSSGTYILEAESNGQKVTTQVVVQ